MLIFICANATVPSVTTGRTTFYWKVSSPAPKNSAENGGWSHSVFPSWMHVTRV